MSEGGLNSSANTWCFLEVEEDDDEDISNHTQRDKEAEKNRKKERERERERGTKVMVIIKILKSLYRCLKHDKTMMECNTLYYLVVLFLGKSHRSFLCQLYTFKMIKMSNKTRQPFNNKQL